VHSVCKWQLGSLDRAYHTLKNRKL